MRSIGVALASACAMALAASPRGMDAQLFHAESVQLLHGDGFHDAATGNATRDGRMTTLTLESVVGWRYGDSFLFVDLTNGDFEDGPAGRNRMYAEWAPRLSLSKITGRRIGVGPVADLLVAGSLDRGSGGFAANLVGLGADLRVPGLSIAQVAVYHRDDVFNRPTYQVTGVWSAPVRTGALSWSLSGFVDVAGTDAGTDVMVQPQALLDLGALAGHPGHLHAGVEWYLHRTPGDDTSAPQAMLRLSW